MKRARPDKPISAAWLDPAPTDWEEALASDEDHPLLRGYRSLLAHLATEGFRVRATSLVAPVQLEGFLPTGEAMYLRCRYETCHLAIAAPAVNPLRSPIWSGEVSRWDQFEAGALAADDVEDVLRELVGRYHDEQTEEPRK